MVSDSSKEQLALVMSGGGARVAYQVGVLRALARRYPKLHLPILTGVSAGAINAAFLASRSEDLLARVEKLARLWIRLATKEVFNVGSLSLARNVLRLGLKLVSGGVSRAPRSYAALDTKPLQRLLKRVLKSQDGAIPGIEANLRSGALKAVAITTSSYTTGQSITWVQGRGVPQWERAHRKSINTKLDVRHVMASAALPIFFPAININGQWFGDGDLQLTTPLSPAIHLGADRILAISTRHTRTRAETEQPPLDNYPPPAQIIGSLFNAVFSDLLDADALTMERMNKMIKLLPPGLHRDYRTIRLLVFRPSRDLGTLANEYEPRLPGAFRFMTRGLGTREMRSNDLLSLLMFQPDYLSRLIKLGEADAEARQGEVEDFLKGAQLYP